MRQIALPLAFVFVFSSLLQVATIQAATHGVPRQPHTGAHRAGKIAKPKIGKMRHRRQMGTAD